MTSLRAPFVLAFMCLLVLPACGGGSAKSTDGGTGGNTSTRTAGMCAPATSTCTQAETNAYSTCLSNACNSSFAACYGPNYKTGSYSGPCATYLTCVSKCACGDTACEVACTMDATCQTCETGIFSCVLGASCTPPACYAGTSGTGGTSGGGSGGTSGGTGGFTGFDGSIPGLDGGFSGTCANLLACCNATSAQLKPACMMAYASILSTGDTGCGIVFTEIKSTYCPTL